MNIVVCSRFEDEIQLLESQISRIFGETAEDVLIFHFQKGVDLQEYLTVSPDIPDAAILSLDQPEEDGLSTAEHCARLYPQMKLALVGRSPGNVEKLFELGVVYFLYTPLSSDSAARLASRLVGMKFEDGEKFLTLSTKKGVVNIAYSDILYVMSDKRKVIIYQPRGKTDEIYMKLDKMQESLDSRFVRCHQSFLVNMDYIHGITTEEFTLVGDEIVPISQNKYWTAKRQYVEYIKSRG